MLIVKSDNRNLLHNIQISIEERVTDSQNLSRATVGKGWDVRGSICSVGRKPNQYTYCMYFSGQSALIQYNISMTLSIASENFSRATLGKGRDVRVTARTERQYIFSREEAISVYILHVFHLRISIKSVLIQYNISSNDSENLS